MKRFAVALAITVTCLLGSSEVSYAQDKHHEMKSMSKDDSSHTISTRRAVDAKVAASMKGIVEHYLQLKNALANDKPKDAATAGKKIVDAMGTVDKSLLTVDQKKLYEDVEDDAKEQAEHIATNAGKIEHQREHFDMLSKDVYDLAKAFGSGQQVSYKIFCPMYNEKKGAFWLSETKEIRNPYYGKKMLTCGSVQEEIK